MPKKGYTEAQFRKDLSDLNKLIDSFNSSVGKKNLEVNLLENRVVVKKLMEKEDL